MIGLTEIYSRFGVHGATIEGPNATAPRHSKMRTEFIDFAIFLDETLPDGRAKSLALTQLEDASMWAHKSVAQQAPVSDVGDVKNVLE